MISPALGDWFRYTRHTAACGIIDRQTAWGAIVFRVWPPSKDAVLRAHACDPSALDDAEPCVPDLYAGAMLRVAPIANRSVRREDVGITP